MQSHTNFVAGVALGDIHFRFAWQAWHKLTSTVVLRGRRGTYGTGWRPWARFRQAWRRGILRGRRGTWWQAFAWQAWHKLTSTVVLRGRRGTYGTGWRPWARFRRAWRRGILRGRRGTWWHSLSFRVVGVHKLTSTVVLRGRRGTYGTGWRPWARFRRAWRRGILRGRRGTWWHSLSSLRVAGVAQTHIYRRFASQAWHLWYWVAPLGPV